MRLESSDCRLSDFRLAWCLETYSLLTASHMVQGDFSTPLEMTSGGQGGQTVERCYPLSAFRGALDTQGSDWERRFEERDLRFERADCRLSAVRLAWCLETYSLFAAGHMARGDFRAPLEMTRGAENSDNQMSDLCYFCSMLF